MRTMTNHVLQSESFERAAYTLQRAMENFGTGDFNESCRIFERSVARLSLLLGMQAANDQRKHLGESMAYGDAAFFNA